MSGEKNTLKVDERNFSEDVKHDILVDKPGPKSGPNSPMVKIEKHLYDVGKINLRELRNRTSFWTVDQRNHVVAHVKQYWRETEVLGGGIVAEAYVRKRYEQNLDEKNRSVIDLVYFPQTSYRGKGGKFVKAPRKEGEE